MPASPRKAAVIVPEVVAVVPEEVIDVDVEGEDDYDEQAETAAGVATASYGSWHCDQCDRIFGSKFGLTKHVVVHTGKTGKS